MTSNNTRQRIPHLLTVAQTAERLQVSQRTVRRLVKDGAFATYRIGRTVRIDEADISEYLKHCRNK